MENKILQGSLNQDDQKLTQNKKVVCTVKTFLVIASGFMLMGNQSCEQKNAPQRSLKKFIELYPIQARSIYLPNGTKFDFESVMQTQVQGVLFNSDYFLSMTPFTSIRDTDSNGDKFFNVQKISSNGKLEAFSKLDQDLFEKYTGDSPDIQFSKEARCFINMPHYKMSGAVNSFELISKTGLSFGYNKSIELNAGIDMDMEFTKAQLSMSMLAAHPMTNKVLSAVNITSNQTTTQFEVGINLGVFSLGPSYYSKTPLSQVSLSALEKSFESIHQQTINQDWYSRVLVNHDTHISIRGGIDVGLKQGDQLGVYNEMGYWIGEPCGRNSQYIGSAGNKPVAIIELEAIGDSISIGKVIEQSDEAAVAGAKVKIHKYIETIQSEKSETQSKK